MRSGGGWDWDGNVRWRGRQWVLMLALCVCVSPYVCLWIDAASEYYVFVRRYGDAWGALVQGQKGKNLIDCFF